MIKFCWNNVDFIITDLGGGVLGEDIARHAHALNCFELHFITGGSGKLVVDGGEFTLKRGDFFITGSNLYHTQITDSERPTEDVFVLIQALNPKGANAISEVFLNTAFTFKENFETKTAEELLREYREKRLDYQSAVAGLMMKIMSTVARTLAPKSFSFTPVAENLNDRRFAIIEQAFLYNDKLTLSELASKIGLCERQTQRLLKKYYGKSFREKKREKHTLA